MILTSYAVISLEKGGNRGLRWLTVFLTASNIGY